MSIGSGPSLRLVILCLDYSNAFSMGLTFKTFRKLQLAQTVLGTARMAQGIPPLRKWHRLPISFQVQPKMWILALEALYDRGPGYLKKRFPTPQWDWPVPCAPPPERACCGPYQPRNFDQGPCLMATSLAFKVMTVLNE